MLSNSKTSCFYLESVQSVRKGFEWIWWGAAQFFFSGGTKPNKEAFAGRACGYLQALSSLAIPRHISYQKGQFKSWSCQERCTEVFCLVYLACLWWEASSKMTSHGSEKYISSQCMFTVFMMSYLKYTDQGMHGLEKKLPILVSWSAEIAQDKLMEWQPSSTEIHRSFLGDFQKKIYNFTIN